MHPIRHCRDSCVYRVEQEKKGLLLSIPPFSSPPSCSLPPNSARLQVRLERLEALSQRRGSDRAPFPFPRFVPFPATSTSTLPIPSISIPWRDDPGVDSWLICAVLGFANSLPTFSRHERPPTVIASGLPPSLAPLPTATVHTLARIAGSLRVAFLSSCFSTCRAI